MEYNIYFIHIKTIEIEYHIFSVHDICEYCECFQFLSIMKKQARSNITHSLNISKIWPIQTIGQKNIFQWLVKLISKSKKLHFRISSM